MRRTTGAATNSKNPARYARGVPPTITWAEGAWVSGDNKRYVDLVSGLGSVFLGHSHPAVEEAISGRVVGGYSYPLPSLLEEEVAERLCDFFPWDGAEMVRYSKNGRDATVAAVRLARAVTGRTKCVYLDYHGADDMFMTEPPWNAGMIPSESVKTTTAWIFEIGVLKDAACVIVEPYSSPAFDPWRGAGWFASLRRECDRNGCLMILDEMVSFGRAERGSGLAAMSVEPDLVVAGKCLADGMPLTAVIGPREHMTRFAKDVFHSATHSGEVLSLAAANAALQVMATEDVSAKVNNLGREILGIFEGYNSLHRVDHYYPARMVFDFTRKELGVMLEHGVLCSGFANLTLSHCEDSEARTKIMNALRAVLSA